MVICFMADITDIRKMNSQAVFAKHSGMIILGGGLVKHHICNANLMVGCNFHLLVSLSVYNST